MATAKAVTVKPSAPVAEMLTLKRRDPAYRLDKNGTRAYTGEQSFCAVGVNIKSGVPSLVHVNGETQTALPLAVVAHAILGGVISREQIEGIWQVADDASK